MHLQTQSAWKWCYYCYCYRNICLVAAITIIIIYNITVITIIKEKLFYNHVPMKTSENQFMHCTYDKNFVAYFFDSHV